MHSMANAHTIQLLSDNTYAVHMIEQNEQNIMQLLQEKLYQNNID